MSEWEKLYLNKNKHDWIINADDAGLVIKYREKPEPKITIKKDGGTWVARYDGVDYLRIVNTEWSLEEIFEDFKTWRDHWKPISEIEITDEIALLRPMVIHTPNGSITKLAMVDDDRKIVTVRGWFGNSDNFRLATVSDLEDDHE